MLFYGTAIADATLPNGCDMAILTGGSEVTKTTIVSGVNQNFAEFTSQGLTVAPVAAIPATPTGKGWAFNPGRGIFATGNWTLLADLDSHGWSGSSATTNVTVRVFKYSGGVYTSIGNFAAVPFTGTNRATYTFGPTSFNTITFNANEFGYVDMWFFDGTGANGDNPIVYVGTLLSAGVAGDMQLTTSAFTPTKKSFFDGYGGLFS